MITVEVVVICGEDNLVFLGCKVGRGSVVGEVEFVLVNGIPMVENVGTAIQIWEIEEIFFSFHLLT